METKLSFTKKHVTSRFPKGVLTTRTLLLTLIIMGKYYGLRTTIHEKIRYQQISKGSSYWLPTSIIMGKNYNDICAKKPRLECVNLYSRQNQPLVWQCQNSVLNPITHTYCRYAFLPSINKKVSSYSLVPG